MQAINFNSIIPKIIYLVLGLIGFIDFITLGALKKSKIFHKLYYPIYIFFSFITLSFIFRPISYTLISNVKKIYHYLILISFIGVSLFFVVKQESSNLGFNDKDILLGKETTILTHYENRLQDDDFIKNACINSEIISNDVMNLFIVHNNIITDYLKDKANRTNQPLNVNELEINEVYNVYIDDSLISNIEWLITEHNITKETGFFTWLNVEKLEIGKHNVTIKCYEAIPDSMTVYAKIYFYKE